MNQLYPIIRRIRRPLIVEEPVRQQPQASGAVPAVEGKLEAGSRQGGDAPTQPEGDGVRAEVSREGKRKSRR
jgi:hypothetical protein